MWEYYSQAKARQSVTSQVVIIHSAVAHSIRSMIHALSLGTMTSLGMGTGLHTGKAESSLWSRTTEKIPMARRRAWSFSC